MCLTHPAYRTVLDAKGDVKGWYHAIVECYVLTFYIVGDFGLATSSLAAVDPSDLPGLQVTSSDTDMTQSELHHIILLPHVLIHKSDVGTFLYIAPEVRSRGGPRNHSKADMYSLGVSSFLF